MSLRSTHAAGRGDALRRFGHRPSPPRRRGAFAGGSRAGRRRRLVSRLGAPSMISFFTKHERNLFEESVGIHFRDLVGAHENFFVDGG
jgi:hypothetical protein